MEVRNCKQCGKLYNYIGGVYRNLCPMCVDKVEEKFRDVKQFIEENPNADIRDVSVAMEVSIKQIEKWIREERLSFTEDSPIGIGCEKCGKSIKTGRFCQACKDNLGNTLKSLYEVETSASKERRSRDNKMRYIEH